MQASRFLPRVLGTAVVEKKSDRRGSIVINFVLVSHTMPIASKSQTDERPIVTPNVQVTTANNKSVKHETLDALKDALITQKVSTFSTISSKIQMKTDFERKLFDATCRIRELEALLRGAKNRYRDCRENSRKNHMLFTEVVSTNFSKLFTLMEQSGIGGDGVD